LNINIEKMDAEGNTLGKDHRPRRTKAYRNG